MDAGDGQSQLTIGEQLRVDSSGPGLCAPIRVPAAVEREELNPSRTLAEGFAIYPFVIANRSTLKLRTNTDPSRRTLMRVVGALEPLECRAAALTTPKRTG